MKKIIAIIIAIMVMTTMASAEYIEPQPDNVRGFVECTVIQCSDIGKWTEIDMETVSDYWHGGVYGQHYYMVHPYTEKVPRDITGEHVMVFFNNHGDLKVVFFQGGVIKF